MSFKKLTIESLIFKLNKSGLPPNTPIYVSSGSDSIKHAADVTEGGIVKKKSLFGVSIKESFDPNVKKSKVIFIS